MLTGSRDQEVDLPGEGIIPPPRSILCTRKLRWESLPKSTWLKVELWAPEPARQTAKPTVATILGFRLSSCLVMGPAFECFSRSAVVIQLANTS